MSEEIQLHGQLNEICEQLEIKAEEEGSPELYRAAELIRLTLEVLNEYQRVKKLVR